MASGMEWSERGKMEKDVDLSLVHQMIEIYGFETF